MELKDVTSDYIKFGKQFVIVDFKNNGGKCLTFLVSDVAHPQVPGYPACSLSYFDTVLEARDAIFKKYNEIGFPKNNCYLGSFSSKNQKG